MLIVMSVLADREDFAYLNAYVKNHALLGKRAAIARNRIAKQKNVYAMQIRKNVTPKSVLIAIAKGQRKIAAEITK